MLRGLLSTLPLYSAIGDQRFPLPPPASSSGCVRCAGVGSLMASRGPAGAGTRAAGTGSRCVSKDLPAASPEQDSNDGVCEEGELSTKSATKRFNEAGRTKMANHPPALPTQSLAFSSQRHI